MNLTSLCKKLVKTAVLAAAALAVSAAAQDISENISVNSVGFLPELQKRASVRAQGTTAVAFTVNRVSDNSVAFTGSLENSRNNTDSGNHTRLADFTALTEPGRYYLQVAGIGRSAEFDIGNNVFNDAYRAMMLGMYLWRCGTAVDATYKGVRYHHAACHLNDGNLQYIGGTGTRDATGGWHDAGDYNKYIINSGITVGLLLKAWENHGEVLNRVNLAPVATNNAYEAGMPKFLAEIKWNLDWVAKMQYDDGKVSHKITTLRFCDFIMPEEETAANLGEAATRYFTPWSTAATGAYVAMMAQASRVYRPYNAELADSWLEKARVSWDKLVSSSYVAAPIGDGPNCRDTCTFRTGEYGAQRGNHNDQLLWAAAEMWETTGEAKFLDTLQRRAKANVHSDLGWADVNALAGITYLMSERTGRRAGRVDTLHNDLIGRANQIVTNTNSHGYGRAMGTNYYWGSHGALTATTYILNAAYERTGDLRYRNAAHEVVGHIFGRNYFGRSYVTGVGHNPPVNPHDRRSIASENPWPGYLVGGPHSDQLTTVNTAGDTSYVAPPGTRCPLAGACYFDYAPDYARNEIAINWNASLIYALSAFLDPETASSVKTARVPAAAQSKMKTARTVQVRGGKAMNIPDGAKVYTLNGRLIAHRKPGAPAPVIRRSGVYIVKLDDSLKP